MRNLILVAAGGLAREVIAMEATLGRYDALLLVDDDERLWGTSIDGVPVVGPPDAAVYEVAGDVVICAGRGATRRVIAQRLGLSGLPSTRYGRVIHPSVEVPPGCSVGPGCILLGSVVLTAGVDLHRHVVVMPNVTLTHDDMVADYATLCAGVALGGGAVVGRGAYLGMNSSVKEGVHVGRDAVLGMGSVLLEDLPSGETWAGVPARSLPVRQQVAR
jgi:sugar O-acyltransferase (sialic acid O-acetyltransferase NeuD family)